MVWKRHKSGPPLRISVYAAAILSKRTIRARGSSDLWSAETTDRPIMQAGRLSTE
jgi:hypothetical protein